MIIARFQCRTLTLGTTARRPQAPLPPWPCPLGELSQDVKMLSVDMETDSSSGGCDFKAKCYLLLTVTTITTVAAWDGEDAEHIFLLRILGDLNVHCGQRLGILRYLWIKKTNIIRLPQIWGMLRGAGAGLITVESRLWLNIKQVLFFL